VEHYRLSALHHHGTQPGMEGWTLGGARKIVGSPLL
jgi:hypothetical protein